MGKVSKWFKKLLGFKKTTNPSPSSYSSSIHQRPNPQRATKSPKKEWDFVKSDLDKDFQCDISRYYGVSTPLIHGIDEAGVDSTNSTVHAPVTTNSDRTPTVTTWNSVVFTHKVWAAVVIQSHFRAYLSRRALRALKGLVKLQALVRGHIVRKQTADMLRRMQALIRAQSRALAGRFQAFESPYLSAKSRHFLHHGPATPDKFEHVIRATSMKNDHTFMLKRNSSKSTTPSRVVYPQKIDKILKIDGGKPNVNPKQRNLFHSTDLSLNSDQFSFSLDETCFSWTDNSPQLDSVSSKGGQLRRGPLTPNKSIDGTRSCLSGYSDCPNYMSYTAAAKAKTRSMSAPKLRPKYDTLSSTKRYSIHGHGDSRANLQKGCAYYSNFTSKAYPGSGRLDKLGMPVGGDADEFIHGAWNIY